MSVSLNGTTLATYSDEEVEAFLRGSSYYLADGTIQHDNVSVLKQRWSLQWKAITQSQKNTIALEYEKVLNGTGSGVFIDINANSYNITVPQGRNSFRAVTINANPLRYNVTLTLEAK